MASSGTFQSSVPIPSKIISCQELLKRENCIHSGWLRRQSLRNKFKIFAWPQVYVVIAGGCIYCYGSEVSRKPASAFSLYGYDKVFRAGEVTEKEATWTFKLMHVSPSYRSYLFSSSSQREMNQWMSYIKREMLRANGKLKRTDADGSSAAGSAYQDASSDSAGSLTSQDLRDIETSIYEDLGDFVLPPDYVNKKEDEDSDDEMDRVVLTRPDLQERSPLPPPVPPRPASRNPLASKEPRKPNVNEQNFPSQSTEPVKRDKESGKPAVNRASKPIENREDPDGSSEKDEDKPIDANDFWSSIYFYGGRDKAHEIISQLADEGVYLVRVNDDKSMVLHVYGKDQAKKFIIFTHNKKYTLDKECGENFKRLVDLIYFYYDHPLPRVDITLSECYLYHPNYHTIK